MKAVLAATRQGVISLTKGSVLLRGLLEAVSPSRSFATTI